VNGWADRATRQITTMGMTSQDAFAATTTPGEGVAWIPRSSSKRMMNTFVNSMVAQITLGRRIQSRPRRYA